MTVNFSAGPAMIPPEVMRKAQAEFCDWHGIGTSIIEVSHRGKDFIALSQKIEQDLRALVHIPDNYHVLFMHGGAQLQFSAIPMNIVGDYSTAHYVVTGLWSEIAQKEAERYVHVAEHIDEKTAYFYYCDNETVNGVEFQEIPTSQVPIVCDMSSNMLSRPIDVSKFGIVFASSQKNLGTAGVTVVIVRDDLLKRKPKPYLPSILDYRVQLDKDSMQNTPVSFAWYMLGLVLDWVKERGGVAVMDQRARERSQLLYDFIDQSKLYVAPVDAVHRSRMNVVFDLRDENLNTRFLQEAEQQGLLYLKGHKTRGGMRASLYNAMPLEGVEKLVEFMKKFETV